jgi:hypothetical protein
MLMPVAGMSTVCHSFFYILMSHFSSHGYSFYAAAYLSGDLKKFHDLIEDIIAQADEVNENFLQVSLLQKLSLIPLLIIKTSFVHVKIIVKL